MSEETPGEITQKDSERGAAFRPPEIGARLILVLECQRPMAGPALYDLAAVDRVLLGRAASRRVERSELDGVSTLRLGVCDARMSAEHTRIVRQGARWLLEDRESTNGTSVNGERVARTTLCDGDLIELGHTLFLFRETAEQGRSPGLAAAQSRDLPDGFSTLNAELARELERLRLIAASPVQVLLRGETGTGKEVLARSIHALSGRPGPFLAVNCGAITPNLAEAQLFGHVKGAFSGAIRDEPGFIRAANFGTLFLDEVGDLPLPAQATLLRVLQERELFPVGSARAVPVDVRVVSATHLPLEELMERGAFRRDLYARLAAFEHRLVPLAERPEDIGILLPALLAKLPPETVADLRLRPEAARALLAYTWPLNVRELEQCLATSSVLARDHVITLETLPPPVRAALENAANDGAAGAGTPGAALSAEQTHLRDELIERLRQSGGNVTQIARDMAKARQQVQRWLRRFGLDAERYRR